MMPCSYLTKSGATVCFDLDAVTDVARGYSGVRASWTALLIYVPEHDVFVELRDSPQDIRGNSADEAVEVDEVYAIENFGLSSAQLAAIRRRPSNWSAVDLR